MSITTGLKREIDRARMANKMALIAQVADDIATSKQHETDLMLQILDGSIFNQAKRHVNWLRMTGQVDKMYTINN